MRGEKDVGPLLSGTMTGASQIVHVGNIPVPMTVVLSFASLTTEKIEISCDGGTEYFEPAYASSTSTQKVVTIGAPVSHVKFTGVATDTWSIR